MTQQFTVRIVGSGPEADLHRKVLASLPEPFQIVPTGKVDAVLLMDGEPAPLDARVAVIADVSARKQSSLSGAIGLPAVRYLPRLTADGGFERARKSQFALVSVGVVTAKSDPEGMLRGMVEALATVRWLTNASCQIAGGRIVEDRQVRLDRGVVGQQSRRQRENLGVGFQRCEKHPQNWKAGEHQSHGKTEIGQCGWQDGAGERSLGHSDYLAF